MSKGRDHEPTAISLECLVSLMKERERTRVFSRRSILQGRKVITPTFLRMTKLPSVCRFCPGIPKTEITKKHPKQQEVIFVLNGTLLLEVEENGTVVSRRLEAGAVSVIERGQCHRILSINGQDATFCS